MVVCGQLHARVGIAQMLYKRRVFLTLLFVLVTVVGGSRSGVRKNKRNWLTVERFSVLRKERLQVPSCELHVRIISTQTDVGACGGTPAIKDQSSQG